MVTSIFQLPSCGSCNSPGKNSPGGLPSLTAVLSRLWVTTCAGAPIDVARIVADVCAWSTDVATQNLVPSSHRPRFSLKGPAEITPSRASLRPAVGTHAVVGTEVAAPASRIGPAPEL